MKAAVSHDCAPAPQPGCLSQKKKNLPGRTVVKIMTQYMYNAHNALVL